MMFLRHRLKQSCCSIKMKNTKGFTLIELIVVLTVTTILLGTVISVLLLSIDMYKTDETKSANQDSLNIVSTSIETNIRRASAVNVVGTECQVVTSTATNIYDLDSTTKTVSLNGAFLADRIESFSCSVSGNTVSVQISTINDRQGSHQSYNTAIVLRKGD